MGIRQQDVDPETWRRLTEAADAQQPAARGPAVGPPKGGWREADFQQAVIGYARQRGWKVAWFRPVRVQRKDGSVYHETPVGADGKGWPDLVLVRAGEIIFAELKVGRNTASEEQIAWLDALRETGAAAGVWRPADWDTILEVLK